MIDYSSQKIIYLFVCFRFSFFVMIKESMKFFLKYRRWRINSWMLLRKYLSSLLRPNSLLGNTSKNYFKLGRFKQGSFLTNLFLLKSIFVAIKRNYFINSQVIFHSLWKLGLNLESFFLFKKKSKSIIDLGLLWNFRDQL